MPQSPSTAQPLSTPPEFHLQALAAWLHEGTLAYDAPRRQYLLCAPDGHPIASATLLQDLCEHLTARAAGRRPHKGVVLSIKRHALGAVRQVINRGESLSAFVCSAIQHEVARRQAEESADLAGEASHG